MSILWTFAQLILPFAATMWVAIWPQRNRWALGLQILGALFLIIGIGLAALWTAIPQWTVLVLLAVWFVAALAAFRERGAGHPRTAALVGALLALSGGWLTTEALLGRRPPALATIDLAMPLDGKDLMVANGGSGLLVNAHQDVLDLNVPRHRLWTGQAYGVDFIALNRFGASADGFMPADPKRYVIFGRPVRAPCTGTVAEVLDGRSDLEVPKFDDEVMHGNFVLLRCRAIEIALAHLHRGSVAVHVGQKVAVGEVVGRVGNSGVSTEPHLHINAQMPGTPGAPFSGTPLAMQFEGRFLARNDRLGARSELDDRFLVAVSGKASRSDLRSLRFSDGC